MAIELKVPYSVDEIKKAFAEGDETQGLLMASNCLSYLKAVYDFSKELLSDGRIASKLVPELRNIKVHSICLATGLVVLCEKYNYEFDFKWLP